MSLSLTALLAAAALSAAPAAPARRVAVLDFSARWASGCATAQTDAQQERCEMLRLFADQARGGALAVLRPPAFVVMTRENTAQILKDMGGQCSEGECEVETARLLGASVVVSGEVSFMEGTWLVSLKVHDVASAALLGTGDTEGKSKLEAFRNVRAETERMLKTAAGLEGVAAAPAPIAAKPVVAAKPPPPPPPTREVEAEGPPSIDVEPVTTAERPASAPYAGKRWSVEARAGYAVFVPGYAEPQDALPKGLGEIGASAGYRLNETWSFHALVSVMPESMGTYSGYTRGDAHFFVSAKRVAVGAAWSPLGNRYFSLVALAGATMVGLRAELAGSGAKAEQNRDALALGLEARFDYPLGDSWFVGARAGATLAFTGFSLLLDDGLDTMKYENDAAFLPLAVAAGYRF